MIALLLAPFRLFKLFRFFGAMLEDQRQWSRGQKLQKLIREYQREERDKYHAWLLGLSREDYTALYQVMGSKAFEEIERDYRTAWRLTLWP
jgi:hypothetical protein